MKYPRPSLPEDLDPEFFTWGFGDEPVHQDELDIMEAWNERHADIYTAKPDNLIHEDIKIMYNHYKDYKAKQTNQGI